MGEMIIGGCLGHHETLNFKSLILHSHHEMLNFKSFDMRKTHQSCHPEF